MINTSRITHAAESIAPEEELKRYLTNSLRQSGSLPLQFLDVEARDGHVYLSARVPMMFLNRCATQTSPHPATDVAPDSNVG